jgi:beta-glucuronidase
MVPRLTKATRNSPSPITLALLSAAIACLLALTPTAGAADSPTPGAPFSYGQNHRYTLDGTWFLKRDQANAGLKNQWQTTRSFGDWQKIRVPNAFNADDDSEQSYVGYASWYATQFTLPKRPRSGIWILQFNSVNLRSRIFLNGRQIGAHSGGFVPFEIPARNLRRGTNTLVLRVDSRLTRTTVPSVETNGDAFTGGWWNFGGILREVVLRRAGQIDLESVDTRSKVKTVSGKPRGVATIDVIARVHNYGRKSRVLLKGAFGSTRVRFKRTVVPSGTTKEIRGTARIRKPRLWSPVAANLYVVQVSGPGGSRWKSKAGIRKFSVSKNGILSMNGLKTRFRGASFHESEQKVGAAWTPFERAQNNLLLEKLGVNMIRSHYPLSPQQMEWADEHGVLVWCQIPVYRPTNTQVRSKTYRRTALLQTEEIVKRYRGYPSLMTWSLINEPIPSDVNKLVSLIRAQKKIAKRFDPQGLVGLDYAANASDNTQNPAFRGLDVLGVNEYFGWYPGANGSALKVEALVPYMDYMHRIYPRQALMVTEFGAEANRNGPADELGTYEYQANFVAAQLRLMRGMSYLNGIFAWALRDYWVRPGWHGGNPDPSPPWSRKGLFQADNTPKPAAAIVEREFKATPPFR